MIRLLRNKRKWLGYLMCLYVYDMIWCHSGTITGFHLVWALHPPLTKIQLYYSKDNILSGIISQGLSFLASESSWFLWVKSYHSGMWLPEQMSLSHVSPTRGWEDKVTAFNKLLHSFCMWRVLWFKSSLHQGATNTPEFPALPGTQGEAGVQTHLCLVMRFT